MSEKKAKSKGARKKQSQKPHTQTQRDAAPTIDSGFIVRATGPTKSTRSNEPTPSINHAARRRAV